MARNNLFILIGLLLLINLVYADNFEIKTLRESYAGKDSVQVMIINNLSLVNDISFSNIKLEGNGTRIPLALNLYKVDYGYFVFFDLPNLKNGSYKFVVDNLKYVRDGVLVNENFSKDLIVENLNFSLSVYPMFVNLDVEYWEKPKLTFKLRNNLNDINISVTGNNFIKPRVSNIKLRKNEEYNLIVDLDQSVEGFDLKGDLVLDYGYKYEIPIYLHKRLKNVLIENKTIVKENIVLIKEGLRFLDAAMVNRTLKNDTVLEGSLKFKNFANVTLHGLSFNLTNDLNKIIRLEYKGLDYINNDEEKYVVLFVNEGKNLSKNYKGNLVVMTKEGVSTEFPIYLIYQEEVPIIVKEENFTFNYTYPKKEEKKESNLFLYIIIIIFTLILIIIIAYVYKKGKSKSRKFEDLFR